MAAAGDGGNGNAAPNNGGAGGGVLAGFNWSRLLFMGFIYYYFFMSAAAPGAPPTPGTISPLYAPGTKLDLHVYLSETKDINWGTKPRLLWKEEGLEFGSWDESNNRAITVEFETTPTMQNNGTIFAEIYFTPPGASPNVNDKNYSPQYLYKPFQLNKYIKKDLAKFAKKNLISGDVDAAWIEREKWEAERRSLGIEEKVNMKVMSFWKSNVSLHLVQDFTVFKSGGMPEQIVKHMNFTESGHYYPIIFANDWWLLNEDMSPINETVLSLTLRLDYSPISLLKFSMYSQMDDSFSLQKTMFGAEEGETEDFKRLLLDNNIYVLIATMIISIAHTILDTLAFKNDIQFWREKKSMEGMSVRTIYANVISNLIILLYLLDNDTSWMILFSVAVGLLIEVWKISRAAKVTIAYYGSIPYPILTDKEEYVQSHTKDHDLVAMKYLYWLAIPLVGGYAVYSVMYDTHKSWYSFVVGTLAGCVYTFGFIMMTPQLFINYKLKSVAHLPWRVFIYKALSTFIDDIFAFLIRMPTLHRLRVFRDDIVFLIYLYQRWIYPVDKRRIEVGADFADVSLDEINAAKAEAEAKAQAGREGTATAAAPKTATDKKND